VKKSASVISLVAKKNLLIPSDGIGFRSFENGTFPEMENENK
jgi:hypothetical protein